MVTPEAVVTPVRVMRRDTVLIRMFVPQIQSYVATPLLLEGVACAPEAIEDIEDWLELHADADRLKLIANNDFFRDSYGRLLGDLADLKTGEVLTDYLIDVGSADAKPNHYADLVRDMLHGGKE